MSLSFTQNIIAQVSHTVNTQGMTFVPQISTITVGDTVTFINTGGFHNVNGSLASFPGNPQGFANVGGVVSPGVMLSNFVFGIPGTYNYQCDPHIPGMVGTIIVQSTNAITITSIIPTNPLCYGDISGSATVNINPGNLSNQVNVQLFWQNPASGFWVQIASSNSNPAFQLSHNFVALWAGAYRVDLVDDVTSFIFDDAFFNLLEPSPLLIDTLITTAESANLACDGSAYVSGSGGSAPIAFSWSNGAATQLISNLCAGIYCVTLTDVNGCTVNTCDTIGLSQQTLGCTDTLACNYDSIATIDDSSCVYSYTSTNIVTACDSYSWFDSSGDTIYTALNSNVLSGGGNGVYSVNGLYIDTVIYTNQGGCDSIIILDLTIYNSTYSYDTLSVNTSIVWNGLPLNVSGDYSVTLINSSGCDSIANINLTVTTTLTWDCIGITCVDPGTGMGIYSSLSACQTSCVVVTPSWDCNNGVCNDPGTGNGQYSTLAACNAVCVVSAIQEHTTNKKLLKVTDILGREAKGTKNEVLFYIYDDGTVEKRIVIE